MWPVRPSVWPCMRWGSGARALRWCARCEQLQCMYPAALCGRGGRLTRAPGLGCAASQPRGTHRVERKNTTLFQQVHEQASHPANMNGQGAAGMPAKPCSYWQNSRRVGRSGAAGQRAARQQQVAHGLVQRTRAVQQLVCDGQHQARARAQARREACWAGRLLVSWGLSHCATVTTVRPEAGPGMAA